VDARCRYLDRVECSRAISDTHTLELRPSATESVRWLKDDKYGRGRREQRKLGGPRTVSIGVNSARRVARNACTVMAFLFSRSKSPRRFPALVKNNTCNYVAHGKSVNATCQLMSEPKEHIKSRESKNDNFLWHPECQNDDFLVTKLFNCLSTLRIKIKSFFIKLCILFGNIMRENQKRCWNHRYFFLLSDDISRNCHSNSVLELQS